MTVSRRRRVRRIDSVKRLQISGTRLTKNAQKVFAIAIQSPPSSNSRAGATRPVYPPACQASMREKILNNWPQGISKRSALESTGTLQA